MKRFPTLIFLACFAVHVCMAVTPSTEWQDVPANATLSQVGAGAGFAKTSDVPAVGLTNDVVWVNGQHQKFVKRGDYGEVDIGFRTNSTIGKYSFVVGTNCVASSLYSFAAGNKVEASSNYSIALGSNAKCKTSAGTATSYSFVWQGGTILGAASPYYSHGFGSFNIKPDQGINNFWIGETNFVDHVANIATNLIVPASLPVKRIVMFIIEVNPWVMERITFTNNANVVYTGFELKASTNNFDKASPLDVKLQFWSQSHSADTGVLDSDKMKIYMPVGNDPSYDMRSYKRIQNTLGMHKGELARMVVLVDTSCLVRHTEDGGKWLSEDNEDLVWVYMRDTAGGTETYPGTSTQWWHPIAPVRWFSKMPNWAQ